MSTMTQFSLRGDTKPNSKHVLRKDLGNWITICPLLSYPCESAGLSHKYIAAVTSGFTHG